MSKNSSTPSAATENPSGQDLAQLREILFGNQAKATDERIHELAQTIENLRNSLTNKIETGLESVATTAENKISKTHQAITVQHHKHQEEKGNQLQQIEEQLSQQTARFSKELKETQQALQKTVNEHVTDLNQKMLDFQKESRRQNDDLRREMLTLGEIIENQKAGRSELASMLIQMGNKLQDNGKSPTGSDDTES